MDLQLTRKWITSVSKCGLLEIDGIFQCYTLENAQFAIPAGTFPVIIDQSARFNEKLPLWYLKVNRQVPHIWVPDRAGIECHPANWPSELDGCIAPGLNHYEDRPDINTKVLGGMIEGSDLAFFALMQKLTAYLKSGKTDIQLTVLEENT